MLNKRVLAVIKRELNERFHSKAFIILTVLMPLLMVALGAGSTFFMQWGEGHSRITIVTETPELSAAFKAELDSCSFVKSGKYTIKYYTCDKSAFKGYLNSVKKEIIDEKITALLYIPGSAFNDKKIEYYAKTPNISMQEKLNAPINKILVNSYFRGRLSANELQFASGGVDFNGFTVTEKEGVTEQSYGNIGLAYVFMIFLLLSLTVMGGYTLQSVIEEKTNRIVEILLSSVKPQELLMGKIVGATICGLFQMFIWLVPVFFASSGIMFTLPKFISVSLTIGPMIYLLVTFLFGLLIFIGLYASIGAIFDTPQDAQQGLFPVMMLIMIPYFMAISMIQNPTSAAAQIASLFPFANIIIMPARYAMVDVPLWQLLVTIVVNILTVYFVSALAGKIYRVGILRSGTKPKWSEVIKWIRYKY